MNKNVLSSYWKVNTCWIVCRCTSGRFTVTEEERETGYAGVLTISKVHQSDYTEYNCTMINAMGSAEAIIVLEQQGLDFFFYIIIFVVSVALLIFILSILFMVYCKRKLQRSSASSSSTDEDEKKVKVEIIRKLSDLQLSDEERRKLARLDSRHSTRGTPSPPRYAEPVDYIPRRRDSWDDPTYRRLSIGSPTPPPYDDDDDDVDRRFSQRSSHEYMEAGDGPYKARKVSNGSYRDVQYESTLGGRRPLERDAYSNHSQYSENQGYGYFEEPRGISISGNRNGPDEKESLVHRDDVSRRSNLSMNSRNKLATNV
ncbi:putative kin of IRRE-like protein 3 [Apostichopus japonicus]|uniref:Putative kin of IRRE-like protein 3 n=1 Tax=Stichopus japonicus TaxID=307972 RepID=A0A2G8LBQ6_STIJA|nr:putative kin of IRRE-like protein 3 [Apostichopus japonicus]